jgi:dephospho-CoA kinase
MTKNRRYIMSKFYNGIVIFGEMGAGKDVLAEQFSSLRANSKIYNMGILCREMMKISKVNNKWRGLERYIGQTIADKFREIDINIMCDYIFALIYERGQQLHGWDNNSIDTKAFDNVLIKQMNIVRKLEIPIIVGGRTLSDLNYWKDKDFLIVGVKVSEEIRKRRLATRDGEKTAKNSNSAHNTESDVPHIIKSLCDEVLLNDGTFDDLRNLAQNILDKYSF